jgi:hypothetical protein
MHPQLRVRNEVAAVLHCHRLSVRSVFPHRLKVEGEESLKARSGKQKRLKNVPPFIYE